MAINSDYNASVTSNLLNSMFSSGTSSTNSASSIFDIGAATNSANAALAAALGTNSTSVAKASADSLQKETAQFLDNYILHMNNMSKSAQTLKFGGIDSVLYDKSGKITEDTVKKTVDSVKDLISSYNDTLSLLNKNSDRGSGIVSQLEKMAGGIMNEKSLEMLGITIEKDGSLKLDADKLTERLNSGNEETVKFTKDLLGGSGGLADKIDQFAKKALNMSASSLIENDLADIKSLQTSYTGDYSTMLLQAKSGAYSLNNMAFLNMLDTNA